MNEDAPSKVPGWYWVVAAVAVVWNLMGCAIFGMELFNQEAMLETMTAEQQEWARSTPGWIYGFFGVAVATGLVGSVCLFIRKSWAVGLFGVCLAAVLVQMIYTMIIAGGLQVMGPAGAVMPSIVIILSGASLWFSFFAKGKGWLQSIQ